MIDTNGQWAVNVHAAMTSGVLQKMGYNLYDSVMAGHYASVYADNPGRTKLAAANAIATNLGLPSLRYFDDIDYSPTANSQDTSSSLYSMWHAMKADGEDITDFQAMNRGLAFGWRMIFSAAFTSSYQTGLPALGQGLHALQDAFVHFGCDMDNHDLNADFFGDTAQATRITETAMTVYEILRGNFSHVTAGMTLDMSGASYMQQQEVIKRLEDAGYTVRVSGQ